MIYYTEEGVPRVIFDLGIKYHHHDREVSTIDLGLWDYLAYVKASSTLEELRCQLMNHVKARQAREVKAGKH